MSRRRLLSAHNSNINRRDACLALCSGPLDQQHLWENRPPLPHSTQSFELPPPLRVTMATDSTAEDTQITVKFTTKLPDKYKVPEGVPVVSRRHACSHGAAAAAASTNCRFGSSNSS